MIINFENTASHKYIVQKSKVYEWLDQKWLNIRFLFLSKNDIQANLCFENSSCNRLSFNNSANSSRVYQILECQAPWADVKSPWRKRSCDGSVGKGELQ